ncbi:hypothetical protein E1180_20145 [Roseibium denhamense]|uniref:DUF2834 domain-containing protein n=1 Tax=Roseibium denhamense TaxID=76305 RepID=A0ABY1PDH6_9HYPH|nr:hypothetical protein [Roseibium denhamense]MTI07818.1 hypothetical protein [Roseibium denhamense]SMP31941.1 hypothetical protein SAMN06265374_3450 [Roseibium denhamense]
MTEAALPAGQIGISLLAFAVLAIATWPYVRAIKPRGDHMLASYLVFLSVFAVASAFLYSTGLGVVATLGWEFLLFNWAFSIMFLVFVVVPAFLGARAAVRLSLTQQGVPD